MPGGRFVTHVVGARPNFVKAAPVIRALAEREVPQRIVHTGQHYDELLSDVILHQLGVPQPDVNLGVGSGTHAVQTAAAMVGLERELAESRPALLVAYGDVNSTLAAALVAAKEVVPLAHVESGLRSFDETMPEEVNRRVTDALSTLLFATSANAVANLAREGVDEARVHLVGNTMIDSLLVARPMLDAGAVRAQLGLDGPYGVVTLHRPSNVDDDERAARIVADLGRAAAHVPFVVPLHPRGRERLGRVGLLSQPGITVVDPLGYLEFTALLDDATVVVTDSGGVQEETTALGVPCVTVRPNTERPITISHGTNVLVEPGGIEAAVLDAVHGARRRPADRPPLWDGCAGARIADAVNAWLVERS